MLSDNPYTGILDRKEPTKHVDEHFSDTINLLREIIDYGTHLIPRCYITNPEKDLKAAIILVILLKNAVSMLDGIEILISKGALHTANLQARGLFETSLFIHWILKKDTDKRVKQYYVWHLRNELMWAKKSIIGSNEQIDFSKKVAQISDSIETEMKNQQDKIKDQIKDLEELLATEPYKLINDEFEKKKNKKFGYDVDWFRPWGPKSRRQMAIKLGLEAQYEMFYSHYSRVMHANVTQDHILFKGDLVTFLPIRQLEGISTLIMPSLTFMLEIYQAILAHFRPGELDNFSRKYATEWRKRFKTIRDVKYNVTTEVVG